MLIKIAVLFLAGMLALAVLGGLRRSRRRIEKFCPNCGRPKIGEGPCACGRGR